jgi:hypothetical protein
MKAGTFALLLAALVACPPPTSRCDFTNCNGCCDGFGTCQAGNFGGACGTGGTFCQVCPSGVCQLGQCAFIGFDGGPPFCGPQNCPNGCCVLGSDLCLGFGSQSQSVCGNFGNACAVCPGTEICATGGCFPGACPAGCTGCCSASAGCVSGQDPLNCGIGGAPCLSCAGGICNGGQCVFLDGGSCDSTNCLGCCFGSECIDIANQNNSQCGLSGAACTSCAGGGTCQMGQCFGVLCDFTNCSGCCDGAACIDIPLQRDFACGGGGAACNQCSPGSTCQSGQCLPPCGPQNCTGCCAATTCVALANESNAQCGRAGGACNSCTGTTTCLDAGICG